MDRAVKIVYIGNKGKHSAAVNASTKGDARFVTLAVAGGDSGEDCTAFYNYLKETHPQAKKYDNYISMIDEEKPDVAIVSPRFDLTAGVCMDCAERGIHILAEKPIALETAELDSLYKKVRESKIFFSAMHFLRFEGAFYKAITLVKNGEIGEVRLINAQKSYKMGKRDDFFQNRKMYGGTIPWVGIHGIDWIYAVSGGKFRSVYASHSSMCNSDHGDLEATCLCHYKLDRGVMASLSVDYLRPTLADTHGDDRLRVVGSDGCLEVIDGKLTLINRRGTTVYENETGFDFVKEFLLQVLGGESCRLSVDEVFEITRIALISRESADRGKELKL